MIASRYFSRLISARDDVELKITVIGIGDGGCNSVHHMIGCEVKGFEFICSNTDALALSHSRASKTIQLGANGLGTGGQSALGRLAANGTEDAVRRELEGTHLLFIVACMGGGTGSGAAPVIARLARRTGIVTVAVVSTPFDFEGEQRMSIANAGLKVLKHTVDSLSEVHHEKQLADPNDEASRAQFFARADDAIKSSIVKIAEEINKARHRHMVDLRAVISWYLKWRISG